jgi:phosphoenolpyruvate carboxylase
LAIDQKRAIAALGALAQVGRHRDPAKDVSQMAILSDAVVEHGHAAGEERYIAIASRCAELVSDTELRGRIFSRLRAEWQSTIEALQTIMGQETLLESNPLLARSIRHRFPYLDPLNHMQIELLKRYRAGDTDENVLTGIHLTINGIAAGLRNSG